jgi:hypothetical protein
MVRKSGRIQEIPWRRNLFTRFFPFSLVVLTRFCCRDTQPTIVPDYTFSHNNFSLPFFFSKMSDITEKVLSNGSDLPRHEEYQYLDLIRRILEEGEHRPDRTGTGTLSLFAPPQLRFSLSK